MRAPVPQDVNIAVVEEGDLALGNPYERPGIRDGALKARKMRVH